MNHADKSNHYARIRRELLNIKYPFDKQQFLSYLKKSGKIREYDERQFLYSLQNARSAHPIIKINDFQLNQWLDHIEGSYRFFDGFKTLEECVKHALMPKSKYVFIRFKNQYYAVAYKGLKQLVMGKDEVHFIEDGYFKVEKTHPDNYEVKGRLRKIEIADTIYHELKMFDPDMTAYIFKSVRHDEPIEVSEMTNDYLHYYILLGIRFKDFYYSKKNIPLLKFYFSYTGNYEQLLKRKDVKSVNPFAWRVKNASGDSRPYQTVYVYQPYGGFYSIRL
ncbi:hypothetical protein MXL46_09165 [Heyndrickxia sporothermodurans]|uniref:Uncharacterized protein n=1 Tax=Siminovitchia thermophila TaxID=1245522 RepID=A0ABS2R8P8_9BACI|nr:MULTISPECIES: hypothetical protein [Bacillaceae]MBM7716031.1 hypothetical protein [Siminovitchia thermophila]MEB6549262.1 hypothetical protein [Heyndrickxia sporothermodurans]